MNNSWICIDASLVVHLVLKNRTESPVFTLWEGWLNAGRSLAAPSLLYYEVSNALHRYAVHGDMSPGDADRALEAVLELHISVYGDADLHRHAVQVARRRALPAAYDAHYLALAERLGAEFWTLDRRLYNAVKEALPWVRLVETEKKGLSNG